MTSLASAWLRLQIRLLKPFINNMNLERSRAAQDKLGQLSRHILAGKVTYKQIDDFSHGQACWAVPLQEKTSGAILYLHGGGYVAGSLPYSIFFGSILAAECNKNVFCLGYSLAPEHPHPAALDDTYAAYNYLLDQGYAAQEISLVGESAGGGLVFALLHKLVEENKPLPSSAVSISPWVDLLLTGASYDYNKRKDIALTKEQLAMHSHSYAPGDKKNKFVSPVYGDFSGFPPALVIAGGDEILLEDSCWLERKYQEANAFCQLIIEPKMWHAYPLYGIKESRAAVGEIKGFISSYMARREDG